MYIAYYKNQCKNLYKNQCTDSLYYMLYQYVKAGQVNEAREALTNLSQQQGLTGERLKKLLYAAVCTNQEAIIRLILDQGPVLKNDDPNQEVSALWLSVLYEYQTAAALLVEHGADANERIGPTPLVDSSTTLIHCLLKNEPSTWNEKFVGLLVDRGADLTARDSSGQTVLHYAVTMGRVRLAELFLQKGADINARDDNGQTPLLVAAHTRQADVLMPLLINYGADIHATSHIGMNVLHCLAQTTEEHIQLVKDLVDIGVSFEVRETMYHRMPIHIAAMKGKTKMVQLYLDKGIRVDAQSSNGSFLLYEAAKSRVPDVLKLLLNRGANLMQRTNCGRTALHSACRNYQMKNISLLVTAGADLLALDKNANTPFSLIEYKSLNPCVLLMLQELVLRKAREPTIELSDEKILLEYPKLLSYYEKCSKEIVKLRNTKFIESCTFYELMTLKHCKIAKLMRNPNFWTGFKDFDKSVFQEYTEHIQQAFERAEYFYHYMLHEEEKINQSFDYQLPYLIVEKLAYYLRPKYIFNGYSF